MKKTMRIKLESVCVVTYIYVCMCELLRSLGNDAICYAWFRNFLRAKQRELLVAPIVIVVALMPVSYTHLDVYKRQE